MLKCLNVKMKRAFTLIEMLVAITIFSLVIGSAVGFFISAIRSQATTLASQKLLDETSYTIEYMGRFLRMAKKDDLDGVNCLGGDKVNYEITSQGIKFRNYQDICQEFYLEDDRLKEKRGGVIFGDLTSPDYTVTSLQFSLSGGLQTDNLQPRVTITMTIRKAGATGPEIKIQTTISQRNLDVQQ